MLPSSLWWQFYRFSIGMCFLTWFWSLQCAADIHPCYHDPLFVRQCGSCLCTWIWIYMCFWIKTLWLRIVQSYRFPCHRIPLTVAFPGFLLCFKFSSWAEVTLHILFCTHDHWKRIQLFISDMFQGDCIFFYLPQQTSTKLLIC